MIIKDCGTVFTQIREHLGKTKGELADELELGKHGERLIARIEQNKEDIQPATLLKLLDLLFNGEIYPGKIWHEFLEQVQKDRVAEKLKYKNRVRILNILLASLVALTVASVVIFFT